MKKKLTLTSILGLIGGLACIVVAINAATEGDLNLFVNTPSLLILIGGTVCILLLSFPGSTLKTLFPVMKQSFVRINTDLHKDIAMIVQLSEQARSEGLLSIKEVADKSGDDFLIKGITLMLDGASRDDLEATMMGDIYQTQKRHRKGVSMVSMIASMAPALGLIGTYIGLVPMLAKLDDPTRLGPLLALALVSSFYGAGIAYLVFSPMSKRLALHSAEERERNELLLEGILGILDAKNPRVIEEELLSYLPKKAARKAPHVQRAKAPKKTKSKSNNAVPYANARAGAKARQGEA